MAITYPLSLPANGGIADISFSAIDAVAMSQSLFTFSQQVQKYPGQRWEATVTVAPTKRDTAEPWVAFLLSLKGRYGTFYLNDPNCLLPQGLASTYDDYSGNIDGAGQTGGTINVKNFTLSTTSFLKAGDYVQIGTGTSATLHKCLTDVNTDATGKASLELWPDVRTAYADNAAVNLLNAKGVFRLKNNVSTWQINNISTYGIMFDCVEAI